MEWPGSLLLAASFLVIHTAVHTAPPSGISSCPIDLENLDDCILNKLNAYIPQLAKGWPEEENGLDPYLIPTAEASYLDGNLTLVLNLKDIVVTGLSSTRVNLVRAKNLVEGKLEFMCKTPKITATGIYGSEGVIISFPLHSSGPFNITLDDLTSHLVVHMKSDNDHLQITDIGLHVMPSLIYVQGGKELDDDNNLGVTMNVYLNENAFELYNLIRPRLMNYFADLIKTIANYLLSTTKKSDVFPNLYLRK